MCLRISAVWKPDFPNLALAKPHYNWENVLTQPHLTSSQELAMSYFLPGAWPKTPESLDVCDFHLPSIKLTKKKNIFS